MADINKIKINGTEYNISPEWASTGTNTIAIGTSSTTGVKLGTVASFADSSSTIKSDYIQLKDTGSEFPTLTLGSDTNSVSINGGLIIRGGDVTLSGQTMSAGYVVGDSATINNDLEVKGDTTISGTLGVTGLTTLGTVTAKGITGSTATIDGLTTINCDLKVTGTSTLGTITAGSGTVTVNPNGNVTIGSGYLHASDISAPNARLSLNGDNGVEIGNNYGLIKSTNNGLQLGTSSAPGLVLGSKNDVTLGNTSSTTIIDGDSITLGDYIKLSSGYINTYNASLEGSSASFSNDVNISGTLNAKGVLNVTSAATFSNTATVSGALKANSTFTSTGAATFNSTITANGAVTANKGLTANTSFSSPNISDDGTNVNIYGGKVRIGGDSPNIQRTHDSNGYYMSMGTVDRSDPTDYNIAMGVYTTTDQTIGTTMMKAGNYRVVCDSNNGVYIGTYNGSGWNNVLSVSGGSLAIGNSSYGSTTVYGPFTVNNGLTASSLSVSGAATFNSTATVSGALKANSTFTSTGAATFNSTITANGAVTANKGLTAKTSFTSPKISDNGSTVTISATTIDVNNGVTGTFDIEGCLTIGSKLNVNGVIEYNPGSGYIVIGSGCTGSGSTCPVYIGTTSNKVSIGKGNANITANSSAGTINIGNDTININNGSSVQIKGGDITIGTIYPIVVGDSQILIGTDNGTPTFINLNFTGDGSIKLGTGSNTIGVGRCGNGGEDTLIVKDTVTANGAVTANSTLSVTGASTFTGDVTASGALNANSTLNVTSAATFNYGVLAKGRLTVNGGFSVGGGATFLKTVGVSGILSASKLTVTETSTFMGDMTANGAVTANKGLTANTSFSSPNISDSSNKLYIGGSSPGIHWYNSGSGYYMSMGTVDYSDPSQYKGVVMGVYSTNNAGEFGTNLGTATTKAGPYRIICDSNSGISIGTYNGTRSSWYNAISIKESTLNIGGDWNTFSIVSENKATFNNDITLGSGACLYANNSATVKGTLNVGNAIYLGNNISLGSNGKLYAQQLSGDSLSLYSGQLTLGSLGIKFTKGDVTIGSGNVTIGRGNFTVDFGTTTLGATTASNLTVSGRINANSGISVTGSISSTSGDISMGSGNLNITKGDVTIGSGCLTVTGSSTSTFNGALVCQGINAGKAFVGDTTTLGTTKCGFLSVTGTTSLVGGLSVSSSTTTLSETTINGKITMGSGTVTVDPSGNVTIGSGNVTIGQSSGINLKCEYGSTKLGYKIGSGTNTSTTTINGDNISIGCEDGGNNIRIGTIDTSNYTAIFGTTSICETGGNLTIGTTGYTTSIRGNLNLSSATIDNITLGTTTLGTTTVNKPLTASSTLNVSGVSNLSGIVNAKSTLNVTSAATFNGLTYTKKTLYAQSALSVSGTTTLGGTVTANAAVTANKGLTAKTSFTSPHISDTSTAITINGITITNNLTSNTITLTNANGYSITLPLTKSSTTSSASSTSSGT